MPARPMSSADHTKTASPTQPTPPTYRRPAIDKEGLAGLLIYLLGVRRNDRVPPHEVVGLRLFVVAPDQVLSRRILDLVAPDQVVTRRPVGDFTPDEAICRGVREGVRQAEQIQNPGLEPVAKQAAEVEQAEKTNTGAAVDAVDHVAGIVIRSAARC